MKSSSDAAAGNGSKASTAAMSMSSRFQRFRHENVNNLRRGNHQGELDYKVERKRAITPRMSAAVDHNDLFASSENIGSEVEDEEGKSGEFDLSIGN